MTVRSAIYFAPDPSDRLARIGNAWLGRDPAKGEACTQPILDGIAPARLREMTASPRRYGLHATLKAPFELAQGRTIAQLDAAMAEFAKTCEPVTNLGLKISEMDGFLALTLSEQYRAVGNLAADCVRSFDPFRAPSREEDLRRRRKAKLSNLEDAFLLRWGYPYVMEAFRFHITLTERLPDAERDLVKVNLRRIFAPIVNSWFAVDGIALFLQERRDQPFHMVRRYALGRVAETSCSTNESIAHPNGSSFEKVITSSPETR